MTQTTTSQSRRKKRVSIGNASLTFVQVFGEREWYVRGLWFDSLDTFVKSVIELLREVKLDKGLFKPLSEEILTKAIHLIKITFIVRDIVTFCAL